FCTREQLEEDRQRARAEKKPLRYNRRCLKLSQQEIDEKIANSRPYTIRLRIPDGETTFNDIVSGELTRKNEDLEDFIIARSDGSTTYNLAVVVDDHEMSITHVIRGNDHITNTFKQIHIYRALGFDIPVFAHVPLILRPDKKKISKRLGDKDVLAYRKAGILPEAMFNYLCLLGWSPKTDREFYTISELVEIFTADNFNASNAVFDEEKLLALNREHIVRKSDHELAIEVAPLLIEADLSSKYWLETRWEYLRAVVKLLKDRMRCLQDFVSMGGHFFSFDNKYDPKAAAKHFTPEKADLLEELADSFEKLEDFNHDSTEQALSVMAEMKEIKRAQLIHATRLAVSGVPAGPSLYAMLVVLSQPVVVERMRQAAEFIRTTSVS
ncbi:MAG: glutamate--tRNA ligase, partial [candidate division Zixibacteria bacterium]|nr:glutamate--tRNA ligase [candidate division Zixibacteria bacterium]